MPKRAPRKPPPLLKSTRISTSNRHHPAPLCITVPNPYHEDALFTSSTSDSDFVSTPITPVNLTTPFSSTTLGTKLQPIDVIDLPSPEICVSEVDGQTNPEIPRTGMEELERMHPALDTLRRVQARQQTIFQEWESERAKLLEACHRESPLDFSQWTEAALLKLLGVLLKDASLGARPTARQSSSLSPPIDGDSSDEYPRFYRLSPGSASDPDISFSESLLHSPHTGMSLDDHLFSNSSFSTHVPLPLRRETGSVAVPKQPGESLQWRSISLSKNVTPLSSFPISMLIPLNMYEAQTHKRESGTPDIHGLRGDRNLASSVPSSSVTSRSYTVTKHKSREYTALRLPSTVYGSFANVPRFAQAPSPTLPALQPVRLGLGCSEALRHSLRSSKSGKNLQLLQGHSSHAQCATLSDLSESRAGISTKLSLRHKNLLEEMETAVKRPTDETARDPTIVDGADSPPANVHKSTSPSGRDVTEDWTKVLKSSRTTIASRLPIPTFEVSPCTDPSQSSNSQRALLPLRQSGPPLSRTIPFPRNHAVLNRNMKTFRRFGCFLTDSSDTALDVEASSESAVLVPVEKTERSKRKYRMFRRFFPDDDGQTLPLPSLAEGSSTNRSSLQVVKILISFVVRPLKWVFGLVFVS